MAEKFPSHVVCDWLGNSEDIARKHYYQTTAEHFNAAISEALEAGGPEDSAKSNAASARTKLH